MIEDTLETDDREADGAPKFSENYIARMLKEYGNLYYPYAHLNETLYLNHKGFCRIMNMHMFPDLKCLHIQCNGKYVYFNFLIGLRSMLGLEQNMKLRTLILCENAISRMTGLETLVSLANLNLSNNMISEITGLSNCVKLEVLNLSHNNLGRQSNDVADSVGSLKGLMECPSIHTLDVTANYLEDPEILPEVLGKMADLSVFECKENNFSSKIVNFRRRMIASIPNLCHLNGMPVFENERRTTIAWLNGNKEGEAAERQKIREEEEAARK